LSIHRIGPKTSDRSRQQVSKAQRTSTYQVREYDGTSHRRESRVHTDEPQLTNRLPVCTCVSAILQGSAASNVAQHAPGGYH
jgi:hypothetical protein